MKFSKSIFHLSTILFAVIYLKVTPARAGSSEEIATLRSANDIEVTKDTPEEAAMELEIAELREEQCTSILRACYLHYLDSKPYVGDDNSFKICYKNMRGYMICRTMTDDQAKERILLQNDVLISKRYKLEVRKEKLDRRNQRFRDRLARIKASVSNNKWTAGGSDYDAESNGASSTIDTSTVKGAAKDTTMKMRTSTAKHDTEMIYTETPTGEDYADTTE